MKKTKIISLIVAILVFVITLFNPLGGKENELSEEDLVSVVMAADTIAPQTLLTKENLYTKKIHKDSVPEGAITDINQVIGKVSHVNLFPDDVLNNNKIYEVGESTGGISYVVDEGMRAVSVDVVYSGGVSGLLKIGNKADLIAIMTSEEAEKTEPMAKVVTENAKIIALDKKISPTSTSGEEGESYATVTFELSPEQALDVSLAVGTSDQIRLALRNQEDEEKIKKDKVLLKDISK